jgi:hypothetical protein
VEIISQPRLAALRHVDAANQRRGGMTYTAGQGAWKHQWLPPVGSPAACADGVRGLAIYRTADWLQGTYDGREDCEHVVLHRHDAGTNRKAAVSKPRTLAVMKLAARRRGHGWRETRQRLAWCGFAPVDDARQCGRCANAGPSPATRSSRLKHVWELPPRHDRKLRAKPVRQSDPTPSEIKAACLRLQMSWDDKTREDRRVQKTQHATLKVAAAPIYGDEIPRRDSRPPRSLAEPGIRLMEELPDYVHRRVVIGMAPGVRLRILPLNENGKIACRKCWRKLTVQAGPERCGRRGTGIRAGSGLPAPAGTTVLWTASGCRRRRWRGV